MRRKFTQFAAGVFLCLTFMHAQAQVPCVDDLNGCVNYKNVDTVGAYQLKIGLEEQAEQTYYYSGPGKVSSVRVYGTEINITQLLNGTYFFKIYLIII